VRREFVKRAAIGLAIDAPEPGTTDVSRAWAELVAEQMENAGPVSV